MTRSKVVTESMVSLVQKMKYSPSLGHSAVGIGRTGSGPVFSSHQELTAHGWDEAVAGVANSLLVACRVPHLMALRVLLKGQLAAIVVQELAWKLATRAGHFCFVILGVLGGVASAGPPVSLVGAGFSAGFLVLRVRQNYYSILLVAALLVAAAKRSRNPLSVALLLRAPSPSL